MHERPDHEGSIRPPAVTDRGQSDAAGRDHRLDLASLLGNANLGRLLDTSAGHRSGATDGGAATTDRAHVMRRVVREPAAPWAVQRRGSGGSGTPLELLGEGGPTWGRGAEMGGDVLRFGSHARHRPGEVVTEATLAAWTRGELLRSARRASRPSAFSVMSASDPEAPFGAEIREQMAAVDRDTLARRIRGSRDFEGSQFARDSAALMLHEVWQPMHDEVLDQVVARRVLEFYERKLAARARTPEGAELMTDPERLAMIGEGPEGASIQDWRWIAEDIRAGDRRGPYLVRDIWPVGSANANVIFSLADHPAWHYEAMCDRFVALDPGLAEVARQFDERMGFSRFLMEYLVPYSVKAVGFKIGLSARIGYIIGGIAIDLLAEELQAYARDEPGRDALDLLAQGASRLLLQAVFARLVPSRGLPEHRLQTMRERLKAESRDVGVGIAEDVIGPRVGDIAEAALDPVRDAIIDAETSGQEGSELP